MTDDELSEKKRSLAMLKSGAMTTKSWGGPGPWVNTTAEDTARLEREIEIEEKRRHLELFESGKIGFHSNPSPGVQVDTTPEIIASVKAQIAELESLNEVG